MAYCNTRIIVIIECIIILQWHRIINVQFCKCVYLFWFFTTGIHGQERSAYIFHVPIHLEYLSHMTLPHFLNDFGYLFLENGEGREKERERNINVWLPFAHPRLET